ncbi:EAL domain-containing protein [Rhizobium sp.]|uniref:EAL domain-containing protein n=1 Tax=Rhizobium sp. TaxID=391 RepID=UPI0028AACF87
MRFWRKVKTSLAVRAALVALMCAVPVWTAVKPFTDYVDNVIASLRFKALQRPASGDVVFVAIDKKSLDAIGVWPWPRGIHSEIIDRLAAAGARDVFLDIDFSSPSSVPEDEKLRLSLIAAGGSTVLPVFRQHESAVAGSATSVTRPISALASNAWLAFANVELAESGLIATFKMADLLDGRVTQSVPAVLAQVDETSGTYLIDYSIDPSTIPTFSASDLLDGTVPLSVFADKAVVVGAYATELKDAYPVPMYGPLAGPLIHILATETILQHRLASGVDQTLPELVLAAALIGIAIGFRVYRPVAFIATAVILITAMETVAFVIQANDAYAVRTANGWILLGLSLLLALSERSNFAHVRSRIAVADYQTSKITLQSIIADSNDVVLVFDENLCVLDRSASADDLDSEHEDGNDHRLTIPSALMPHVEDAVLRFRAGSAPTYSVSTDFEVDRGGFEARFEASITISRSERLNDSGEQINGFIGSVIARDVTARRKYEADLLRISQVDELTGLLNRREFINRLQSMIEPQVVVAVGLHRFPELSATLGRPACDQLLRAIASRLSSVSLVSHLGRVNGDCFVMSLSLPTGDFHEMQAEAILRQFALPFEADGSEIYVDARLGISLFDDIRLTAAFAVDHAETALIDARSNPSSNWIIYAEKRAQDQLRARKLEQAMRASLRQDEFFLAYQPQVDLATGQMVGAETLMRWRHPDFGLVSPGEFIPVAESSGVVCDLGTWALRNACTTAMTWPPHMTVAVNVSPIQFAKTDILAEVKRALAESGLAAHRLHLEITESAFLDGTERLLGVISQLRSLGVCIALDDFGTGYSSLSYMAGFPLDKLKIDQSFVRKLTTDHQSFLIVKAVTSLAHGLGLKLVAEGIEKEEERRILAELKCEEGQGYLFGRPQSAEEIMQQLASLNNTEAA